METYTWLNLADIPILDTEYYEKSPASIVTNPDEKYVYFFGGNNSYQKVEFVNLYKYEIKVNKWLKLELKMIDYFIKEMNSICIF